MDNKEYKYAMKFALKANEMCISGKLHASQRYAEWAGTHLINAYAEPEEPEEINELAELIRACTFEELNSVMLECLKYRKLSVFKDIYEQLQDMM